MKEIIKSSGSCAEEDVIKWTKQLAEILSYLHNLKPNPIIYRDMKPGNIIIDSENNAKLIDFGIAREYKIGQESDTTYIGTRGYAAPEQLSQAGQSDERTDIYGLGATVYHALTGRSPDEPPYYMLPVREINGTFSEGIEKIIGRCVADDPNRRYQNAGELLVELNNIHTLNRAYKIKKLKQRLLVVVIIIFMTGGAFAVNLGLEERSIEQQQAYRELIEQGVTYFNQKNLTQAQEVFNEALAYDHQGEVNEYLARIYIQKNENQKAIEFLNQKLATGQLQNTGAVLALLGTAYFNQAEYNRAIAYFESVVRESKKIGIRVESYVHAYRDLAVSYGRTGDFQKARKILEELSAVKGIDDHIIIYIKGEIELAGHNFESARAEFSQAHLANPQNIRYKISYAQLLGIINKQGLPNHEQVANYQKAIALLTGAHQIDRYNIQVLKSLGKISYDLGLLYETTSDARYQELFQRALTIFNKLVAMGLQSGDDFINIGILNDKLGKLQQADAAFRQALQISPDSSRANLTYGLFKLKQKEYDVAYRYLQKTVDLNQSATDVSVARAKINELREKGWVH